MFVCVVICVCACMVVGGDEGLGDHEGLHLLPDKNVKWATNGKWNPNQQV